jgi:hypothetical protein
MTVLRDFLEVHFTFPEKGFLLEYLYWLMHLTTCFRVLVLWLEALMISCCILYPRRNCLNYFKLWAANSHLYGMSSWNFTGVLSYAFRFRRWVYPLIRCSLVIWFLSCK